MSAAFVHRFEPATAAGVAPVLLLHGTGGDENDLMPLGRTVAPGAALLSPRGQVLEHGMPRFFRRLAEGVFDENDVRRRALDLANFIADARERHGLAAPLALGYSNGANIAAAVLLLRPDALAGAILLRAMVPLAEPPRIELNGQPVLIVREGRIQSRVPTTPCASPTCCAAPAPRSSTRSFRRDTRCRILTWHSRADGGTKLDLAPALLRSHDMVTGS